MIRNDRCYDVKDFISKKNHSGAFVSVTLTLGKLKIGFGAIATILIVLFLLALPKETDFINRVLRMAITNASPFLKSDTMDISVSELFVRGAAAPFFKITEEEKEEIPKIIDFPNIKKEHSVSNGIDIKNETDYNIDVVSVLAENPISVSKDAKVLIVHTHGSESYTQSEGYNYSPNGNFRTQDTDFNVIRVGETLASRLKSMGIRVIHDKTINDFPSYNDSYNKTESIIKKHLQEDKNIGFVFDIHRDAVGEGDNIVKFVADVGGKEVAQVMMVCGTDTNLENPHWMENLRLALRIQNKFEEDYPGFLRPLNLRKERFNMHLTKGSLLFEIGTSGNTMEEALLAADYLGEGLGNIIKSLMK